MHGQNHIKFEII